MPSVHRQKNNIVHGHPGLCAKSAAPDVLYAARIDVYNPIHLSIPADFRQQTGDIKRTIAIIKQSLLTNTSKICSSLISCPSNNIPLFVFSGTQINDSLHSP